MEPAVEPTEVLSVDAPKDRHHLPYLPSAQHATALLRSVSRAATRYGWIVPAFCSLLIGYLLVWQRGRYLDDYPREIQYRSLSGPWKLIASAHKDPFFPARLFDNMLSIDFAGQIPRHEFIARSLATVGVAGNALLLGWLMYRALGSRFAAIVAGWLILIPFVAFEAVLWLGSADTIFVTTFALLFLHAAWSACVSERRWLWWLGLSVVFVIVMIFIGEHTASVIGVVPFLGCAAMRNAAKPWREAIRRIVVVAATPMVALSVVYVVFYRHASIAASRGGVDVSVAGLLSRTQSYFGRLRWMTVSKEFGRPLMGEAFRIGWTGLVASWQGITFVVVACLSLFVTVITWQPQGAETRRDYGRGVIVAGAGVFWFFLSIPFPAVLLKGQILEYRLLYFPLSGLVIVLATLAWAIAARINRPSLERAFVALAGIFLIGSGIVMLGFSASFAARSQLDHAQVMALVQAVPSSYLPADSVVAPIDRTQQLSVGGAHINALLSDVFQASWSADAAIADAYGRNDLRTIPYNHWVGLRISEANGLLSINGTVVPIDQTVLFTERGGKVAVIERVIVHHIDGVDSEIVFPIAAELYQHGVAITRDLQVTDNVTLYAIPL